jgi:hypothetical protein
MSSFPTAEAATLPVVSDGAPPPVGTFAGILHIHVAFDWGDEIDLEQARRLAPAAPRDLPRRRRTPSSITYRPPPLRFPLAPAALKLPEIGPVQPEAEATLFDFGAVSVDLRVPFRLPPEALTRLAGWLADPTPLEKAARSALEALHQKVQPAIHDALWQTDLSEEYFVFQLFPRDCPGSAAELLQADEDWLAGLVRLESGPLSKEEIAEAVRLHISYSPEDLFIADWAAAVLLDYDCGETLEIIEFANLQLLEFRHIDNRLDDSLAGANRLIHPTHRPRFSLWRSHARPLRQLGELKVEANGLFERTGNVLKLVGDQYLARVYRLLAERFHLEEWENSIQRKLEVAEGIYQVVSDQAESSRSEFLEVVVVLLILLEVILALFHR